MYWRVVHLLLYGLRNVDVPIGTPFGDSLSIHDVRSNPSDDVQTAFGSRAADAQLLELAACGTLGCSEASSQFYRIAELR